MPWQCKLITEEQCNSPDYKPEFGHMRFAPWIDWDLSPEYKRDWEGKRPPIVVCIPQMFGDKIRSRWFCPDSKYTGKENGWTVTGEVPNITVSPSINAVGSYHGWLQNGILSDDLEGRIYA